MDQRSRGGHRGFALAAILASAAIVGGCEQAKEAAREKYYQSLEKVGLDRREVLVKRVGNAREAQQDAQKQFRDALQEFQGLVGFKGGKLEAKYEKVRGEYEDAVKRADDVRDKIRGVRNVASSLFQEWQRENGQYQDQALRRESERALAETRQRYDQLIVVMDRAAERMDPVLKKLHDQVLFLKHNLNARALGSLQGTADKLQTDVGTLVADMEASIREAETFIRDMGEGEKK